ncbi:hypothetical protein P168DRAFT_290645 [Aspergillus campestris IBT 28561]|uniref:Uncharacterized protein n=1 Tax=Aspergillus campestris (strain IBT 28561) TaxID=1392248 RepID=A0A2I1D0U5_ASPC2|nr:uncharacterized protein P168DRAFT_290645 [Aspergillus campestris IBT 28561]PKY03478.1 hypothetical protein P168DRAFT_290645 [Aspergillus campestris IBT 28561]
MAPHAPHAAHGRPPHPGAFPGLDAEAEWGPESSSVEDDEPELLDAEDLSSVTDGSDEEDELHPPEGWRGSLYRRHSPVKPAPQAPRYRTHYRKQPSKSRSASKQGRRRYPGGVVDVVPADSKHGSRRTAKGGSRELLPRPARPTVIHGPVSSDDLDLALVEDPFRGGRARNDIRTRILDDREARIERREKMIDYRTRLLDDRLSERLDDRLDEPSYLGRSMSLREPTSYHPSRRYSSYLPGGLH